MQHFEGKTCKKCGGMKFKLFSKLDFEERLIADRMAEKQAIPQDKEKHLVCTRCFTMLDSPDFRA